jgi:hypothetical protein
MNSQVALVLVIVHSRMVLLLMLLLAGGRHEMRVHVL